MAKKILLVEDDQYTQDVYQEILKEAGFEVTLAIDGQEGLQKAQEGGYNLILLDIMMPKMDGLQVCAKLKKDPTMQKIPIIMVTAKAQETDQQWGKECGADSYITKPYQFDALIKQIRELLGI